MILSVKYRQKAASVSKKYRALSKYFKNKTTA
jgi:hypothetical protein